MRNWAVSIHAREQHGPQSCVRGWMCQIAALCCEVLLYCSLFGLGCGAYCCNAVWYWGCVKPLLLNSYDPFGTNGLWFLRTTSKAAHNLSCSFVVFFFVFFSTREVSLLLKSGDGLLFFVWFYLIKKKKEEKKKEKKDDRILLVQLFWFPVGWDNLFSGISYKPYHLLVRVITLTKTQIFIYFPFIADIAVQRLQ